MKVVMFIALLFGLSACGVDGPPTKPGSSVQVSGEARIGVIGGL